MMVAGFLRLFRALSWLLGILASVIFFSRTVEAQPFDTLEGRYGTIITDLPDSDDRRQWIPVLDAAIPIWCEYWQVSLDRVAELQLKIHVMSDKQPFARAGMIPAVLPDFPHGFQMAEQAWVLQQPSPYYTRHLILHEAVHATSWYLFQGSGPPWHMEGMAEYLATHRWDGERLAVGIVPASREECPYWGRFKMLELRRRQGNALGLLPVLSYSDTWHRQVEPYAWTWAAYTLFNMYPDTRPHIVEMAAAGADASPDFRRKFLQRLGEDWTLSKARWRVLIDEFDYGYDTTRSAIDISLDEPIWNGEQREVAVGGDQGWKSSGVRLRAGDKMAIRASGRVTLAQAPRPWESFPEGVTIRFRRGQPLGKLLATLLPVETDDRASLRALEVTPIGEQGTIEASVESWLLLRVNDEPSELGDNAGHYDVVLQKPS